MRVWNTFCPICRWLRRIKEYCVFHQREMGGLEYNREVLGRG
jgi:hypothetical protein